MNDLQYEIVKTTVKKAHLFQISRVVINSVIFIPFALIVFWIAAIVLNWISISMIVFISFFYTFLKELMIISRTKKTLINQSKFLMSKNTDATLYIPILEKVGKKTFVKSSALFIQKDKLFLEAFRSTYFSTKPTDSISVPYGKDFEITEAKLIPEEHLIKYSGTLMDTEYHFYTIDLPGLIHQLSTFITFEKGNYKDVNTTQ
ncbi:MAG: hypothetical protein KKE16_04640 [Firmicutes bacterium]|nr:hypothetical protein [Bacillota bacterium]